MKLDIIILILTIIISFSCPLTSISQQEYSEFLPNAHSIGMGGSGVALPYDPAASYWNPANIAFLTTNRVLININNKSYLNCIALTKFFPPSFTLGINIFRPEVNNHHYDIANIAIGYRMASFFSVGTNFNFSKTMKDEIYSSFGFGLFFKSYPNFQPPQTSYNSIWNWFRSKQMKDKFCLGFSFHNIPFNYKKQNHEIRLGAAVKPHDLGPLIHFAYHFTPDSHSLHLGTLTTLSKYLDIYFGVKDLNINRFALGGAIDWGPFQMDLSYDFKYSNIYFSVMIRLSEEKSVLFQKYKDLGTRHIKNNDFKSALKVYLKALAYEPENKEINYLVSILNNETSRESKKIDSLFIAGKRFEEKDWFINAFISYQKILEIDRDNRKAQKHLKSLNSKLVPYLNGIYRQGVMYFNQNDLNRAKRIFEQIIIVDKKHQGANSYLAKIDSINTSAANEYYYRGLGYYNQRNLSRALDEFKEALTANPNHEPARQYLEKTEREIETNQQKINQFLREAQNYELKKQYVKATISYRKILEIDKSHQYAREKLAFLDGYIKTEVENKFQRAQGLYDQMDYSGAIVLFNEILSIDPDHRASKNYLRRTTDKLLVLADQHYERAQNFFHQKKWDLVLQECNLTLTMNSDHSGAKELQQTALANISIGKLLEKGLRYYERSDYLNARSTFKQVLAKEPNNVTAQNYLNRIETGLKERVDELFNMGMVKYAEGDYEEAIKEWKKILDIDPNYKSAKEYIQKAQERIDALKRIE